MAKNTGSYETVLVLSTRNGEEGTTALTEKFKALVAENGTTEKVELWGKRRLAYPIQDEQEGYYLLIEFTSSPEFPAELDRVYKITDGILRTLIISKDEAIKAELAGKRDAAKAKARPPKPSPAAEAVPAAVKPAAVAATENV